MRLVFVHGALVRDGAWWWSRMTPLLPAEGTMRLKPELAPLFVHDCDEEAVAGAMERLAEQSAVVLTQSPRTLTWRTVPSTYVVCAEDRATPPDLQREQAKRASEVVELPTGHHPFLSHPELLTRVIVTAAG